MKLAIFLLMVAFLQVRAEGISQTVSLTGENVPLEKAFAEIEAQTGYFVAGNKALLKKARPVSVSVRNMPLKDFLDLILKGQPLRHKVENKTIFISAGTVDVAAAPDGALLQVSLLTGIVQDREGKPIVGATVTIKGGGASTATDVEGKFSLLAEPGNTLVISSVGYATREISINASQKELTIILTISTSPLDEVRIIAYGQTTKRLNTGNTTTVSSAEIQRQPVNNILQALQGRVPGMQITAVNNSLPGATPDVKIRGINSIGAGTSPLYILDGVPIPETQTALTASVSGLMIVNPADVERIDILKDAEATAIYGSRGANGVILITTKKGQAGKTRLSVNAYTGFAKLGHRLDFLDVHQYLAMRREASANTNVTPTPANSPDLFTWDSTKTSDWQKEFIGKTAVTSDINASVSGGSTNTQFLINAGYHTDETVFPGNTGDTRKSVRFAVNHADPDGRFGMSATAAYTISTINLLATDLTGSITLAPHYPLYTEEGTPNFGGTSGFPLAYLLRPFNSNTNNFNANINLRYTLLKGLNIKLNSSIFSSAVDQSLLTPIAAQDPAYNPSGSASIRNNDFRTWIMEPQAEYAVHAGRHSVKLLAGGTWQSSKSQEVTLQASGFTNDALLTNISSGSNINTNNSESVSTYVSFFSRLTYDYRQQYLANLSFRRDGSSKFGPGKRFGNFGAVSVGWIFTQNNVIRQALSFMSFGKLRASYGINGNDQISGNFDYLATYGPGLPYQLPTLRPQGIANPEYRWEENRKLEVGLELGFLKDRLLFTASWFRNRTDNQLIYYTLPPQTGSGGYTANFPAKLGNKGLELELISKNISSPDFSWQTSLHVSASKNKLIEFPGIENTSYSSQYFVGQPLTVRQAYRFEGLSNTGIPVLEDIDKNNSINANDRYIVGSDNPLFGGMSNIFMFRNFNVTFFLEYTRIRGFDNTIRTSRIGNIGANVTTRFLDRWQQPGDEMYTVTPLFTTSAATYNARNFSQADVFWGTSNIFRLRNLSFSYDLPASLLKKARISKLQLYMLGQNLWVGDKLKKHRLDPETGNGGMPPLRTITFGINCTL